jgi:RimJ/RimL family protein N-acetyltransferase
MQIPVLSFGEYLLRPLGMRDFAPFFALHSSPHAALMWAMPDAEAAWKTFLALVGEWQIRGYGMWAIADKGTDAFLGHTGFLHPYDATEPELGWALTAAAQGRGIASGAVCTARDWGRTRGIVTPISHIDARNLRSIRLAERIGARLESRTEYMPTAVALHYRHPLSGATA